MNIRMKTLSILVSVSFLSACSGDAIVGTWEVNADNSIIMEKDGVVKASGKKADRRKERVEECKKAGFDVSVQLDGTWKKDGDKYEIETPSLSMHREDGQLKKCEYTSQKQVGILDGDELKVEIDGKVVATLKRKK